MPTRIKTVALVTNNALVALDLTTTIEEVLPWAKIVPLSPPLTGSENLKGLPGLLAVVIDQAEVPSLDLEQFRNSGALVIVIGDGDAPDGSGLAYLPMPFTTEMLTSVLSMVAPPDTGLTADA
jgi:hypothetical protein